ncbi:MAG: methylated-DNA--[protein]-cysteine S-methyltransferase [Eubacterium sp.]|nr:methylated-DNA--[protein]-cysteine S-methyltransferase [Eubacterium sp.]
MYKGYFTSQIGIICVEDNGERLISVKICEDIESNNMSDLTDNAVNQLKEYLGGARKNFDLPLEMNGTEFQQKVWNELCNIPYGETRSYKDIAEKIGNPKAARAVGSANNKNKFMIIVPCHRVVGANGSLTGYAGGIDMKKKLLELEQHGRVIKKFERNLL